MIDLKRYIIYDLIDLLNQLTNESDISEIDLDSILMFSEIAMIHFDEEARDPYTDAFFIDHVDMGYSVMIPPDHWIDEEYNDTWIYAEKERIITARVIEY
jgi:hypothetical protein